MGLCASTPRLRTITLYDVEVRPMANRKLFVTGSCGKNDYFFVCDDHACPKLLHGERATVFYESLKRDHTRYILNGVKGVNYN